MFVGRKGKKRGFKGFTLGELVIVLVILGVLVALAVPRFTASASKAKETTFCSNVRTIKSQLELYKMTTGSYPADTEFNNFLGSGEYFESPPVNPYTGTAFKVTDTGTTVGTATLGEFNYIFNDTPGTYTITSTPACDIVQ